MGLLEKLRAGLGKKDQGIFLPIKKVGASRGLYEGRDELPSVQFRLETTDGDLLILEMKLSQAREAIEQLTYTYYAIVPPIKNRDFGGFE